VGRPAYSVEIQIIAEHRWTEWIAIPNVKRGSRRVRLSAMALLHRHGSPRGARAAKKKIITASADGSSAYGVGCGNGCERCGGEDPRGKSWPGEAAAEGSPCPQATGAWTRANARISQGSNHTGLPFPQLSPRARLGRLTCRLVSDIGSPLPAAPRADAWVGRPLRRSVAAAAGVRSTTVDQGSPLAQLKS
jgi:hypothetical protein